MVNLSEASTPEILAELTRRGTTFAGLANLVNWSDNSKGSFVRFAIDMFDESGELRLTESPFKGCLEGVRDGQTFFLTAVMTTREKKEEVEEDKAPEEKPKQSWDAMRPQQQAGILCGDEMFGDWLADNYYGTATKEQREDMNAAELLKHVLQIDSRKDLEINPIALGKFQEIVQQYRRRNDPPYDNITDAG